MNQRNHYVSTYQKDYTWPDVSSIRRPQPIVTAKDTVCTCIESRQALKKLFDLTSKKSFDWSRMGPMGRLLDPKLYPTKLEESCSDLYKELKKSMLDKTAARVDADRMKTTYQVDYSDPATRLTQRDKAIIEMNGQQVQCSMPIKITIETKEYDSRPRCRSQASKFNGSTGIKKYNHKSKNGSQRDKKYENAEGRLPSWRSEYQESIDKIGQTIMRAKLHHIDKKSLPVLITSNQNTCN